MQTASSSQKGFSKVSRHHLCMVLSCPTHGFEPYWKHLMHHSSLILLTWWNYVLIWSLFFDWWMTVPCIFMILFACWCEMFFCTLVLHSEKNWCQNSPVVLMKKRKKCSSAADLKFTFSSFIKWWGAPTHNCQHCGDGGVWITSHCFSANRTKVIFLTHTWLCMLTHTEKNTVR